MFEYVLAFKSRFIDGEALDERIGTGKGHAMRSYERAIICEPVHGTPHRFVWRSRLWRVSEVQRSWVEAVPWWTNPDGVGGPEGERFGTGLPADEAWWRAEGDDWAIPAEPSRAPVPSSPAHGLRRGARQRTVWRVVASSGDRQGVYDLASCEGEWSLIAAVD